MTQLTCSLNYFFCLLYTHPFHSLSSSLSSSSHHFRLLSRSFITLSYWYFLVSLSDYLIYRLKLFILPLTIFLWKNSMDFDRVIHLWLVTQSVGFFFMTIFRNTVNWYNDVSEALIRLTTIFKSKPYTLQVLAIHYSFLAWAIICLTDIFIYLSLVHPYLSSFFCHKVLFIPLYLFCYSCQCCFFNYSLCQTSHFRWYNAGH